mgnify:CR=1 FL=1
MGKLGYLVRNNRGLYLKEDGKVYFIDKHCKDKDKLTDGLCKYHVVNDKERYGFIFAENIVPDSIRDAIKGGTVNFEDLNCIYEIKRNGHPSEKVEFVSFRDSDNLWVLIDDVFKKVNLWDCCLENSLCTVSEVFVGDIVAEMVVGKPIEELSLDRMIELFVKAQFGCYAESIHYVKETNTIFVRDGYGRTLVYTYFNGKLLRVTYSLLWHPYIDSLLISGKKEVNITDNVKEFVLENNLCMKSTWSDRRANFYIKSLLESVKCDVSENYFTAKEIKCNGDILCWKLFLKSEYYSKKFVEKTKNVFEENTRQVEAVKKKLGKSMSRDTVLNVVPQFNTVKYQMNTWDVL